MNLKIDYYNDIKNKEYIDAVNDGQEHQVVLSTNSLDIEPDRKDPRYIKSIKNVKMIFGLKTGGCLIMIGSLGCDFKQPVGGMFFVKRVYTDTNTKFEEINGVWKNVIFCNYPMDIDSTQTTLQQIVDDKNFIYNLSQFDEFMDIFTFYKTLSSELNNNVAYEIISISKPYYYVPIDEKELEVEEFNKITNLNGIVIGYKLETYQYERLSTDLQDRVKKLVDVKIAVEDADISTKKVKSFSDNLYLTANKEIDESMSRNLTALDLFNIQKDKNDLILSGEANINIDEKYKYLNLYDMGQKIKLESIDNSLRLIKQGASGSAAELLEFIIGSKEMPSNNGVRQISDKKDRYLKDLDDSQKKAFLMATDNSPVSLIKGPPGTGKTFVINAIVQYITKELKGKVVISSQTHVAIDNVLDHLMENYDLIIPNRITNRRNKYSGDEIDSTLYKTWAKKFDKHNARSENKDLSSKIFSDMEEFKGEKRFRYSQDVALSGYSVLGATTTTSAIGGKKGLELLEGYDWLIIDEVSKCPITEVLRYLPYVERIIMVGDDFQLAPLLEFTKQEVKDLPSYNEEKFDKLESIYQKSVFANTLEKARKASRLVELNVNYRSVKDVLNAYNIFYNGKLKNMREVIRPTKVQFNSFEKYEGKDIFFVEVKNGKEAKEGTSRFNIEELEATADILRDLMKNTVNPLSVSVSAIFPYAAQIDKFQKKFKELINEAKKCFKSFEIDTVDAFQGKETDIVLVNTVVTDTSQRNFLNDFRRINVSMSRARDKLFLFGNSITLSKIQMEINGGNKRTYFSDIIEDIRRYGKIIEYKGALNYGTSKSKIEII